MTAKNAALEPWWHRYDDADRARQGCLAQVGIGRLAERLLDAVLGRAPARCCSPAPCMPDPGLLLLDEPTARLDLARPG